MSVSDWVGRKVRVSAEDFLLKEPEEGTVLAVDDTPYRPSAWVRVYEDRDYPGYRSADLCQLTDIETGEIGPTWGAGGPEADIARLRARRCLT